VAGHPADVGGAPVGVFVLHVENPFRCDVGSYRIAACCVQDSFRLPGGSGGVKEVEGMLGVERLGRAFVVGSFHEFVPPLIAAFVHFDGRAGSFVDDHILH